MLVAVSSWYENINMLWKCGSGYFLYVLFLSYQDIASVGVSEEIIIVNYLADCYVMYFKYTDFVKKKKKKREDCWLTQ